MTSQKPQGEIAEFADVAAQLEAVGVAPVTSLDDPGVHDWIGATMALALPQDPMVRAADPLWRETFGFDVFQIDQSLVVGEPPNLITILRGRFDQSEVESTLKKSGYKSVDVGGLQGYSLYDEPVIDLKNKVAQLTLGKFNNAGFLPDGTLVFAGYLDTIRQVVAVSKGEAPSLASRVDISALVQAMPRALASAILIPGSSLSLMGALVDPRIPAEKMQALMDQVKQLGEMPPVSMALFGISPGGPLMQLGGGTPEASPTAAAVEPAVFDIGLLTLTPAQARTAEQTVVARVQALDSQVSLRPYRDLFTGVQPAGPANLPIAVLELTLSDQVSPRIWTQLIQTRDLLFLGW
jgi:hypothetical protein